MQLTKILDERNSLVTTVHYPYKAVKTSKNALKHKAVIGVGGNIGDVIRRFEYLFWFLMHSKKIKLLQSAPILKNPPFGYKNQPDFYNTLLVIQTNMTPKELLKFLLKVEKKFRRVRSFKDAPRTLDLDIIFYDDIQMDAPDLTIPHPQWFARESILVPLKYLKGSYK